MRRRRILYAGALGLALAVAIPGSAMATGKQNVEAGFLPSFNTPIPIPPPTAALSTKQSKAGSLYTRLFLSDFGTTPSAAGVFDIHAPEELTFNTKGLDQCNPADIEGRTADEAKSICADSFLGEGSASAFVTSTITVDGPVALFAGTPQNGFDTVLFHSTAGTPITLVAEMQDSPLAGYGTLFHTLVAISAGGKVPDGTPIVDTDFNLSKKYTDKKLKKKAKKAKKKGNTKKAKKLKKKSKKSFVTAACTDGTLTTQVNVTYVSGGGPPQEATSSQSCTS